MVKKAYSTYAVPILVGALILLGSLIVSYQLSQYQNEIKKSNKEKFTNIIENTISRREGRINTIASSVIAFYANSEKVEPIEFDRFVGEILGKNQEIINVFTLSNNTITQSFPIKEYVGRDFDEAFPTYPTVVAAKKAMTVEFPVNDQITLILAVPFDYFVQEGVIASDSYKLVLLSPIDDNVELYKLAKSGGITSNNVEFTEQELRNSVTVEHQTTLFGHKIQENYDLKYFIWDISFNDDLTNQIIISGMGMALSILIPILLIRSNLLKIQLQEKSTKLESLNEELIQVEKSKDEFVTMIVHDLKNPLVPIHAYTDMLLEQTLGSLNEKQIQRLQSIKNSASSLQKLIQDLLDANKLELGMLKLNLQDNDLAQIIQDQIHHLDSEFQKKGIAVSFKPKPVSCQCDGSRIGQVLNNILINSIDFVDENSGKIVISLDSDQKTAKITIQDNGIGIAKDKIGNLFVKFYQINPNQQRKYGGTGLGLAVCKGIMESHGGKIWAESDGEGKGTKFHMEIPLRQPEKA
ncbi:sensor histidine kinase [Candidatus Nitrosotenuis aquarius]|uniref:sensor histidine kinase n=1 Tax=Candidatus Nitrosotenuis aquarius TaxID=1846278 RepID=UPI000C1EAB3D|nr:HAMP domain-containing sensor histidine kinase [Candidatus Nitrosotenuis aquarius]